jgi:hypothetical protein
MKKEKEKGESFDDLESVQSNPIPISTQIWSTILSHTSATPLLLSAASPLLSPAVSQPLSAVSPLSSGN